MNPHEFSSKRQYAWKELYANKRGVIFDVSLLPEAQHYVFVEDEGLVNPSIGHNRNILVFLCQSQDEVYTVWNIVTHLRPEMRQLFNLSIHGARSHIQAYLDAQDTSVTLMDRESTPYWYGDHPRSAHYRSPET